MLAFEQMNVKSFYQRHDLLQVYVKLRVQELVEDEALSQVGMIYCLDSATRLWCP